MELGQSREDYLECLLMLEENGKIRSVDVAKKMNVSKPSVNKAMNVLKEYGYITQENYGDIHLTEKMCIRDRRSADGCKRCLKQAVNHIVSSCIRSNLNHITGRNKDNGTDDRRY